MPLGASGIFGNGRAPPSDEVNIFNAIGRTGGLSKYSNAFGDQIDEEDNEAALIFRQFGGFGSFMYSPST